MASTSTSSQTGLYVYGITSADYRVHAAAGVGGAAVETVVEGGLAAIVSEIGAAKIRAQRANLAAHHRVLHDLAEEQSVLPVVFGTMTGNEEELQRFLRVNHDALAALLDRLRGRMEMGLKVYWDLPNVFEYFVANHRELEAMRNRLFRPGRTPSVEEKVELGELFASLLQKARERHTRRIKEVLASYCVEVRSVDPGEERLIAKVACLVEKDRQGQWEEGVRQAASHFDDHYRFEYNGPWAPYNFVDVDLRLN